MKIQRGKLKALVLMLSGLTAANAQADSAQQLLDVLLQNGTITQQQYTQLVDGLKTEQQDTLKSADNKVTVQRKGASMKFNSDDGGFDFQVGGRVMVDVAGFTRDNGQLGSGVELRRARLFAKGTMWDVWDYKFQYDFTGTGRGGIRDAYLQYAGLENLLGVNGHIRVGNFKEPFSLEEITSSKYITFMERALPVEVFSPSRNIGGAIQLNGKVSGSPWVAGIGMFGEGVNKVNKRKDQSYGVTSRISYAPTFGKNKFVHIGASGGWRDLQNQKTTLSTRPEAHISDERLVSVDLGNAESAWKAGAELAAVWGPASFQGEYIRTFYDTVSGDAEFDGYYGYVSYFLTGESRAYDGKTGAFKRVKPMSIVGKNGGYGAWEFAARYSYIDLNDGVFNGGRERNYSFGLNWHATPNIRLMANYTYVDSDDTRLERDLDPHIFQGRLQADF